METMRPVALLAMAFLLVPLFPLPGAHAQSGSGFEQCGEIQLVFRNPDLGRQGDGRVHAHGSFFAQFQAIGADADKIATFGFSFGPVESSITSDMVCDNPPEAWFTGAYIINYRADRDPDDGFFINLQTPLVPDGVYAAAVHAYDADDNELARAWTNAVVDNCDDPGPVPPARCDGDDAQIVRQDKTQPWPIMLPGDGELDPEKVMAPPEATFTVEFAEALSELHFYVNTVEETQNLTAFEGRLWDDDLVPGYGPHGLGGLLVPECTAQPPQECNHLGEAYYWAKRALTNDDVVRIEATDLAGNLATKEIHIGSGTTGAITGDLPNLQMSVDALQKEASPETPAVFRFTLQNSGGGTAHPFSHGTAPEGWHQEFTAHRPIEAGDQDVVEMTVAPPTGTPPGAYAVNATIEYPKGGGTERQTWDLTVVVGAPDAQHAEAGNTTALQDGEKESPLSMLPVVGALVAVAWAVRRRG